MGVKEDYTELSKKHKLPSFAEMEREFEISTLDEEGFLLREVRRKITEKVELYFKFLEEILQPEITIANMHESREFNEEEREKIFKLFSKLMFLYRLSMETSVNEDDQKSADYINTVFTDWDNIKDQFSKIVAKAKESWINEKNIKEDLGYMG